MCGVLFHSKHSDIDSCQLLSLQAHRGPDKENILEFNDYVFGHNRLSIIDIDGGNQPKVHSNTGSIIIYNGEIYNYKRLYSKYITDEVVPTSDTEAILHLLDKVGLTIISEFEGMFAIVYYDGINKKYYFIRDPFGIKPLYYCNPSKGVICVSSEPKVIFTFLKKIGFGLNLDERLLPEYFHYRSILGSNTLVKGVKKVEKSCFIEWDCESLYSHVYNCSPENTYRNVEEMLGQSVSDHLLSDVEVGMFLSGGVDSSLIAKHMPINSRAFTVSSSDHSLSEEGFAQRVADKYGMRLEAIIPENYNIRKELEEWMYFNDDPVSDPSALALYMLSKEVKRRGVKVLLAGEGADEIFLGYGAYRRYLFAKLIKSIFRKNIGNYLLKLLSKYDRVISDYIHGSRFMGSSHISTKEDKEIILLNKVQVQSFYNGFVGLNDIEIIKDFRSDIEKRLSNDLLMRSDRATMAASLELRTPFLTPSVLAFANNMKLRSLISLRLGKKPLKRALLKEFDSRFVYRKKVGFDMDVKSWIEKELNSEINSCLVNKGIPGIDYDGVSKIITNGDNYALIWAWFTLEKWYAKWVN